MVPNILTSLSLCFSGDIGLSCTVILFPCRFKYIFGSGCMHVLVGYVCVCSVSRLRELCPLLLVLCIYYFASHRVNC